MVWISIRKKKKTKTKVSTHSTSQSQGYGLTRVSLVEEKVYNEFSISLILRDVHPSYTEIQKHGITWETYLGISFSPYCIHHATMLYFITKGSWEKIRLSDIKRNQRYFKGKNKECRGYREEKFSLGFFVQFLFK